MKLSQIDMVARHVQTYKSLKAALSAVETGGHMVIKFEDTSYGDDPDRFDIPTLTSPRECRQAIKEVLIRHVGEAKQALATYGVDIDE